MSHLKRQEMPKSWPVPRKGTTYIINPLADLSSSIPLLIVLRNMLNVVQNRKEAKNSIHLRYILLNARKVKDEKVSLYLFDTLSILPSKKNYRVELSKNGKFDVKEIKESESNFKIAKVLDKRTLKGKKIQLNLSDGRNFLSDIKCNTNDSVLVNLKDSKIEKCISLKENSKVLIIGGKHIGENGIIKNLDKEKKMANVESNGVNINVLIKQLIVTE